MGDRVVVSCGSGDQKLFISSCEGVTLHEVVLPFKPACLSVSATKIAVGGNGKVCLVSVEAVIITATLLVPSLPCSLAFDEQGSRLACGLDIGLTTPCLSCVHALKSLQVRL